MSDQNKDAEKDSKKKDSISIIYHQRNDSPKYFEIKRSKIYLFFIGLPALTLVAVVFGAVGILNTSPIAFIKNYRENQNLIKEESKKEELEEKFQLALEENEKLKNQLAESAQITKEVSTPKSSSTTLPEQAATNSAAPVNCPPQIACPSNNADALANSIGLSTLSLFRPIQGQKDRTRPAVLNLSGFKTAVGRDTVNLQFNIIPSVTDDSKISGHIIVLMKNEIAIQAYPLQALGGSDFQINYSAGEPFSTQRFRPVDASFVKPRKTGNYSFTVFIFSRSGDLIHFQSINLPVSL